MKTGLWTAIVATTWFLGYLTGYAISSHTGVEPGFFEGAGAGGYGAGPAAEAAAGTEEMNEEYQEYYKDLGEG